MSSLCLKLKIKLLMFNSITHKRRFCVYVIIITLIAVTYILTLIFKQPIFLFSYIFSVTLWIIIYNLEKKCEKFKTWLNKSEKPYHLMNIAEQRKYKIKKLKIF
jgi:hypothetical protein